MKPNRKSKFTYENDLKPWNEVDESYRASIEDCLNASYKELLAGVKVKLNTMSPTADLAAEHYLAALRVKYIIDGSKIQNRILALAVISVLLTVVNLLIIILTKT